jgi:hypothetical protein
VCVSFDKEEGQKMKFTILFLSLLLLTGCPLSSDPSEQIKKLEERIKELESGQSKNQRYQIVTNPNYPRHTYFVDTQKGKIWIKNYLSDVVGNPEVWLEEDIIDNSQEIGPSIYEYVAQQDRQGKMIKKKDNAKK